MTALDRFDRVFADGLADLAQPAYPDYIDDALYVATRRRQRPAWAFPERWLPMTALTRATPFPPGLPLRRMLLLAIAALLIAGLALVAAGALRDAAPPYGLARSGLIVLEADGNVYTRDALTGEVDVLAATADLDVFPFFARDGSKVAWFQVDPATAQTPAEQVSLLTSSLDGSPPRVVLGPESVRNQAWSPSSDALVMVTGQRGQAQLSIVSLDGTRRDLDLDVQVLDWADWRPPDGREIVFRGRDTTIGFFAVRPDGTGLRPIPITGSTVTTDTEVQLTPDGRSIVYGWAGRRLEIRIADLETGAMRPFGLNLPNPEGGSGAGPMHLGAPRLSADGASLVFGRYWDEGGGEINHQVWVASLGGDGSDAVPVSPVIRSAAGHNPFLVLLSPDGSQIIVHLVESDRTWITDGAGGNRREVDWGQLYALDWQRRP